MSKSANKLTAHQLGRLIYEIRGRRVLLDADLTAIYGVTTAALNQAVKRNEARFPADFCFQLSDGEIKTLISQNVISKPTRGGRTKPPRVFTESGALQAANVLRSKRAVAMSLFVIEPSSKCASSSLQTLPSSSASPRSTKRFSSTTQPCTTSTKNCCRYSPLHPNRHGAESVFTNRKWRRIPRRDCIPNWTRQRQGAPAAIHRSSRA